MADGGGASGLKGRATTTSVQERGTGDGHHMLTTINQVQSTARFNMARVVRYYQPKPSDSGTSVVYHTKTAFPGSFAHDNASLKWRYK